MDAGKIYNSWPLMGSSYFPDDNNFSNIFKLTAFSDPSLVQFLHRNLAYVILIFYLFILFNDLTFLVDVTGLYLISYGPSFMAQVKAPLSVTL